MMAAQRDLLEPNRGPLLLLTCPSFPSTVQHRLLSQAGSRVRIFRFGEQPKAQICLSHLVCSRVLGGGVCWEALQG